MLPDVVGNVLEVGQHDFFAAQRKAAHVVANVEEALDNVLVGSGGQFRLDVLDQSVAVAALLAVLGIHLLGGLFGQQTIDAGAVAKASSGADHLWVHLGGESVDELGNEVVEHLHALSGNDFHGDQLARAVKDFHQLLLRDFIAPG